MTQFLDDLCEYLNSIKKTPADVGFVISSKNRTLKDMEKALTIVSQYGFKFVRFGENRISELLKKLRSFGNPDLFHYIGISQTRIVEKLAQQDIFIETVQSKKQLDIIRKFSRKCFIQVNISNDIKKSGFSLNDALELTPQYYDVIEGVMTILDPNLKREERVKLYSSLRSSFKELLLSAGMSEDWKEALYAGSDIIRIGRALFEGLN